MVHNFPPVDSYNKLEDDFHSEQDPLRAYNDYLEEVETISMDAWFYGILSVSFFGQLKHQV